MTLKLDKHNVKSSFFCSFQFDTFKIRSFFKLISTLVFSGSLNSFILELNRTIIDT